MAFPTVQTRAESANTAAVTNHVVTLPTGIQAGDLLVVILAGGGTNALQFGTVTGWSELLDENVTFGAHVWYRLADGTEGATQTFASALASRSAHVAYRISGTADPGTQAPQISTVATGTSNAPNPGSISPAGGARDYLFLTFFAQGSTELADTDGWANNAATNYSQLLQKTSGTGGTNVGAILACCERTANVSSEDAVWPAASTDNAPAWRAFTIAVHPAQVDDPPIRSGLQVPAMLLTAAALAWLPPHPQPPRPVGIAPLIPEPIVSEYTPPRHPQRSIMDAWWPRKPLGRPVGGGVEQQEVTDQPRPPGIPPAILRAWERPHRPPAPVRIASLILPGHPAPAGIPDSVLAAWQPPLHPRQVPVRIATLIPEPVAEHIPPGASIQPHILNAWRPIHPVQIPGRIAPLIPADEAPAEFVPPRSPVQRVIRSWWPWKAQGRSVGGGNPDAPPAVDQPPPRSVASSRIIAGLWRPQIQVIQFHGPSGIAAADAPPPRSKYDQAILRAWQYAPQPVQRARTLIPAPAAPADDPPPRSHYGLAIARQWVFVPGPVQLLRRVVQEGAPPVVPDQPFTRLPHAILNAWQPPYLRLPRLATLIQPAAPPAPDQPYFRLPGAILRSWVPPFRPIQRLPLIAHWASLVYGDQPTPQPLGVRERWAELWKPPPPLPWRMGPRPVGEYIPLQFVPGTDAIIAQVSWGPSVLLALEAGPSVGLHLEVGPSVELVIKVFTEDGIMSQWHPGNTNSIELVARSVKDKGARITGATVTAEIRKLGNLVTGMANPLVLVETPAASGRYFAAAAKEAAIVDGDVLEATVVVDAGADKFALELLAIPVTTRVG